MSPEISIGKRTVINVPDETGMYETPSGKPLYVNTDLIDASRRKQQIILKSDAVGGVRVLGLTQAGVGRSDDPKRGDGKLPLVSVRLHDRPIRVTYGKLVSDAYGGYEIYPPQTHRNPRWIRGHGQR